MNILIFKTNINSTVKLNYVKYLFSRNPQIKQWSLDQEDIDNVLRIESAPNIIESDIINLLSKVNIVCEDLNY